MKTKLLLLIVALLSIATIQAQDFNWNNATVYFVLTDRFNDGDPSNNNSYGRVTDPVGGFLGGDLKGLTAKINDGYFSDLGVTAIWMTAPYEQIHGAVPGYWNGYPSDSHYAYHGYYALDFTEVDANMGTEADMQAFVDAAHSKGIRVIMDIVLNHVGYETTVDAATYGFGPLGDPWQVPNNGLDPNGAAWCNWWTDSSGTPWLRKGDTATDYCSTACGGGDLDLCLAGLPDIRTEMTTDVGLPVILQTKWDATKEANETAELNTFFSNTGLPKTPANHIVKWLTDWVRDYGIDGFRIDTYKHVEREVWGELKMQAQDAFDDWKTANPSKVLDNNDFWMVGEWYGHGPGKNTDAVVNGKTDALINFDFQSQAANPSGLESTYANYAGITADPEWTFLSYVSSHDTYLFDRNDLFDAATSLMLSPSAVQIFYGDESQRQPSNTGSDQDSRSFMNWGSTNTALLSHWQKLGQFRQVHVAVGAGSHTMLAASPYTFTREFSDATDCDKIVVVVGAAGSTTVDVSSVYPDGTALKDFYTGNTATVSGGNVTFSAHSNGVILIELDGAAACPPVVNFVTQAPNAPDDCYDPTSLTVAIEASVPGGAPLTIYYTTDGTIPTTSSTVYTSPLTFGDPTDLTLQAIACDGMGNCSPIASKNYIVGTIPSFTVYFKRPAGWAVTPKVYFWDAAPTGNLADGTWPGVDMTLECGDWYSYTFNNILNTNLIFNNGSGSGSNQTNNLYADQTSFYDDPVSQSASYSMKNGMPPTGCTNPVACFTATPDSGAPPLNVSFDASCSTTPSGTTITSYAWDYGDSNTGTGVTSAHTYTTDGTYTVTLTVVNDNGDMDTHTFDINVSTAPPPSTGFTVYFEKPATWGTGINIHHWNALPAGSAGDTTWPGNAMTDEGGGWYSYTFPSGTESSNIIFNDGSSQTNNLFMDQVAWFATACLTGGSSLGSNGNWVFSDPSTTPAQTYEVYFENTAGWTQPKIYYWDTPGMSPATVAWPGVDMTNVSGNLWKFTFTGTSTACLIFNDGNGAQTADLSTVAPGGIYNYGGATWSPVQVVASTRVFLHGPYDTGTGLMKDGLRAGGYIPLTEPYTALGYTTVQSGGESTNAAVLSRTGSSAIVDWVFLELRDRTDPTTIVATKSGLVQADGLVVSASDGVSPISFVAVPDDYYVVVKHRNHLGVCTGSTVALSRTAGSEIDFTSMPDAASYGTHSQKTEGGKMLLWGGDGNGDGKVKYSGGDDDLLAVLVDVLTFPSNTSFAYNYDFALGYFSGDYNMDGKVKYSGGNTDPLIPLVSVLTYPPNSSFAYNYDLLVEQIP